MSETEKNPRTAIVITEHGWRETSIKALAIEEIKAQPFFGKGHVLNANHGEEVPE